MFSTEKVTCTACGQANKFGTQSCAHCQTPITYSPAHGKTENTFLHAWDGISYCLMGLWVVFIIMVGVSISNFFNDVELIVVFLAPISILVFIGMIYGLRSFISHKFVENERVKSQEDSSKTQ